MDLLKRPTGRTSALWHARGYQEALRDMRAAYEQGGEQAMLEWMENNTLRTERKT